MELHIVVDNWKIRTRENKSKTIAGEYNVMCGPNKVASSSFNDGYNSTDISIPSELLVKAEALSEEIKELIIKNFRGEKDG